MLLLLRQGPAQPLLRPAGAAGLMRSQTCCQAAALPPCVHNTTHHNTAHQHVRRRKVYRCSASQHCIACVWQSDTQTSDKASPWKAREGWWGTTRIPVRLVVTPLLQHHCCWHLLWRQQQLRRCGVGQGFERPLDRAAQLNRQRHRRRLWCRRSSSSTSHSTRTSTSTSAGTSRTSAVVMCRGSSRSCWRLGRLSCHLSRAAAACW